MHDLLEGFTSYLAVECSRSPRTVARYRRTAAAYMDLLAEARVPLGAVPRAMMRDFLAGSGRSRSGWNNRLAAVRALYEYLQLEHGIEDDPTASMLKQPVHADPRVPLSFEEMLRLVEVAETESPRALRSRDVALVQVLLHTALRVSELASLNVAQVDLQGHHLLSVQTKGAKRQTLPVNDLLVAALERYLQDRKSLTEGREQPALFVSVRGTRLSVRAIQDLVTRLAERAGITRRVSPHLLRHSSATALSELTGVRVVQDILGHASLATTQRYLAVRTGERRKAVNALAERWRLKQEGSDRD